MRSAAAGAVLLALSLLPCFALIGAWVPKEAGRWPTLALSAAIAFGGLVLITRLSRELGDPRLRYLALIYLGKLPILLLLLCAGWMPMLDPTSDGYGYDPQRFYYDSATLAESGFDTNVARAINVNYPGILYFYGAVFALVGHNPLAPALVNAFVTLLATLVLVRAGYTIKRERGPYDWTLGLGMVIPEVIWFDALTARETLVMSLVVIATLAPGLYFVRPSVLGSWQVLGYPLALFLLGLVRTPLLVPTAASLVLMFGASRLTGGQRIVGLGALGMAGAALWLTPAVGYRLGAYPFDYETLGRTTLVRDEEFFRDMTWSDRSVGQILVPSDAGEALVFALPRLLLYVVAPLPRAGFGLDGLLSGRWSDWQSLCFTMSSLLYVSLLPLAVAGLIEAFRTETAREWLVLQVPFGLMLLAVAAGNQIVHERYRLIATLLFWGSIWLGQSAPGRLLVRVYQAWGGLLGLAGLCYLAYKVVP